MRLWKTKMPTGFTLVPPHRRPDMVNHCLAEVGILHAFLRRQSGESIMSASGTAAYGMYPRNIALPAVVCALRQAGFEKQDICMVLSPAHPDAAHLSDASRVEGDDGKCVRMLAWYSQLGAVVIPTVGFFVRSQEFLQALTAELNLPALSRWARTLMRLGFSSDEAKRLSRQLADVGAMVYISCPEGARAHGAIELLRSTGAREAASLGLVKTAVAAA